jgi:hypothetical protein
MGDRSDVNCRAITGRSDRGPTRFSFLQTSGEYPWPMRSPQHYLGKGGKPLIRPSFCVFADLLGLVDRIRSCRKAKDAQALCDRLYRVFANVSRDLGKRFDSRESLFAHTFVSDALVLGAPSEDLNDDAELGFPLLEIAYAQLTLVLAGFPIRGGLTFGNLHMSERLVFGPSFLRAYEIEREQAKFPRIVVSEDVIAIAERHLG